MVGGTVLLVDIGLVLGGHPTTGMEICIDTDCQIPGETSQTTSKTERGQYKLEQSLHVGHSHLLADTDNSNVFFREDLQAIDG